MDGRGAGILIRTFDKKQNEINTNSFFPKAPKSISLFKHISNMYKVKSFIEKSSEPEIVGLSVNKAEKNIEFKFKTICFSVEETKKIENAARAYGDKLGVNLFLMTYCSLILKNISERENSNEFYWLPLPCDTRLKGAAGPIISNNISCLFFRVKLPSLENIKEVVNSLSVQMNEQLKLEMPKKYGMLLEMMKFIPSKLYSHLINRPGNGAMASFLYTFTAKGIHDLNSLFGIPIENINIYPPKTYPPGLTFAFQIYKEALRVTIAYSNSIINENGIKTIEEKIVMLPNLTNND